jgi:DNA polymerase III alpha subunit
MKQEKHQLHALCRDGLKAKGLDTDPVYVERLNKELKELDAQGWWDYFLKLHTRFKAEKLIFPYNEYNNLVDYVLDLAPSVDITKPSAFVQGEMPDIDIDFLREARDYIKRDWAPKKFGQEKICEIGTYGTTGIKSAILDMARIHEKPRDEVLEITTTIKDKWTDDEGNAQELEWDKALEIYPHFSDYCQRNKEISDAAQMLLDRNKTAGVHAGGLVISNVDIDGFVPLEVRMVNKDNPNGVICSAWTEGLNRQDLGPVGLIKFDLLVINNLRQIALACKLIKDRYPHIREKGICALPGDWDWSDISYLNDPKSLTMANKADLKCIFQFDSEGMRKLVKRGGVTCFDDLAVYSALYRPGPLNMGMDARYCKRKRGEEPFNIHPVMEPYLKKTYGILAFQEQIMDILRIVGEIPDAHTEKVRKAISKKKIEIFRPYKEQFVENGQLVLNVNAEYVINLWDQIAAFAEYGFNASHAYAYAYISARLLWLKAHYPIEFYTAVLMEESEAEKLKDYKLDAKCHGIEVCPVHINKSKSNFSIQDNKIYFGFSNIKSIGDGVADRIEQAQPYEDFTDFLDKFGTDATPIKALTALGVYEEEHDRLTIRKFSEFYKKQISARKDRQKRFEAAMDKKLVELKELLLEEMKEDDPEWEKLFDFTDDAAILWEKRFEGIVREVPYKYKGEDRTREVTFVKQLKDLMSKRQHSIDNFWAKEKDSEESPIDINEFNPATIKIDEEEEKILTDELELDGRKSYPLAERKYYGFQWTHKLETCPDYTGNTIDKFLQESEEEGLATGMIEVEIMQVNARTSKNGNLFWSVLVEDANGKQMNVNIWKDDHGRFEEELKAGNLVKMRVRPPSGGFNTLSFVSYPRHQRKNMPSKEEDARLLVMKAPAPKPPPKKVHEEIDLDNLKFDPDAIIFQPITKTELTPQQQKELEELQEEQVLLGMAEAGCLQDYYEGEAELDCLEDKENTGELKQDTLFDE